MKCTNCKGEGQVWVRRSDSPLDDEGWFEKCPVCNGTGDVRSSLHTDGVSPYVVTYEKLRQNYSMPQAIDKLVEMVKLEMIESLKQ